MSKFTGLVLALDLATVSGYAYGRPGKRPKFGTVRFAKAGASRALIYRAFRLWMDNHWNIRDQQPELIVFESAATPIIMSGHTNIDTIKLLIGLTENLEEWAFDKFELREASVGQVRSHFIGGNFKREQAKAMTIARCKELHWFVENDNEADACALWDYQVCALRPDLAHKTTPLFA